MKHFCPACGMVFEDNIVPGPRPTDLAPTVAWCGEPPLISMDRKAVYVHADWQKLVPPAPKQKRIASPKSKVKTVLSDSEIFVALGIKP